MAWNSIYSAFRYFRRSGAIVAKKDRLIIFKKHKAINARYEQHRQTLEKQGYNFTMSLFANN